MIPTEREFDAFVGSFPGAQAAGIGRLRVVKLPELDMTVAVGGWGKAQFAVHTQHLIDTGPAWEVVICRRRSWCPGSEPGDR